MAGGASPCPTPRTVAPSSQLSVLRVAKHTHKIKTEKKYQTIIILFTYNPFYREETEKREIEREGAVSQQSKPQLPFP